ncbi:MULTISPECIES: DNA-directed RNA polymerase subunit omega [unclassified Campylobacter]|uniref:DNA-directed RNA polymerase subunit omega n=1 Tax=unclassified Campylobacter TaxID=2593542 RepID=UPI001BDB0FFA|nr:MULTISPECIES: DNA-directed RNA polymerase subunit omega [unclassified Campylobacter]MBZ7976052.1 DNA-directed RNA polymerase subunit omega [Campylobacter sp. RM12637]MBZ7977884.1 DNA-directed RNA polymerase subunit omega [Campylobacter sp. RM12654]MBZ7979853.1 DNA-directed RNA polymerase subunit omega [Campylobacter sp. RM12642]MBZ7982038.1 DNA-directed RNA polymerase subunit omega [Campylobacter sp. RM12640]MBZ7983501.1 DNA-directed RNA polymerase subunit omega [Campylobacter sp. RM12647]
MRTEQVAAKALEKVGNDRYILSLIVAKRARELSDGAEPLVKVEKGKMKFTDIAMLEVAEEKIIFDGVINE